MSARAIDSETLLSRQIQNQGIVFVVFNTVMLMLLFVFLQWYLGRVLSFEQSFKVMAFSCALNMVIYVFGLLMNVPHKTKLPLVTLGLSIIFLPILIASLINIVSGLDFSWYGVLVAALMLAGYKFTQRKGTDNTTDKRSLKANAKKQHKHNQNNKSNDYIDDQLSHYSSHKPFCLAYIICFYHGFYQYKLSFIAIVYLMQIALISILLFVFNNNYPSIQTTGLLLQSYFVSVVIYSIFKLGRSLYVAQ